MKAKIELKISELELEISELHSNRNELKEKFNGVTDEYNIDFFSDLNYKNAEINTLKWVLSLSNDMNKYQITYKDDNIDKHLYWICECAGLDYVEELFFKTHDVLSTIIDVKKI